MVALSNHGAQMATALQRSTQSRDCAIEVVLRDMGNGVVRIIHFAPVFGPLPSSEGFDPFGAVSVPFPLHSRIQDAVCLALCELGLDPSRTFSTGFMRPLSDDMTEVIVW